MSTSADALRDERVQSSGSSLALCCGVVAASGYEMREETRERVRLRLGGKSRRSGGCWGEQGTEDAEGGRKRLIAGRFLRRRRRRRPPSRG